VTLKFARFIEVTRAPRSDALRNRQRLLDAAADTFAIDGLGAPLEPIAARAWVSIGTLYNHFTDRDGLVTAVTEDAMNQLLASADRAAALDDAWAAFEALIVGACELQARNRAIADILGSSYPVTGPLDAACAHLEGKFVDVIDRGQRTGVLRPDLTVADMGPIMWSVARIVERSGPDQADAWRRHLGIILDGLRWTATAGSP
jgi:AcrR family transcriptional regulator